MTFLETLQISTEGMAANKLRSALTMLGVIIGVVAVVLLISISLEVKRQITGSIENLGSNLYLVMPGSSKKMLLKARTTINKLTTEHALKVKENCSYPIVVAPVFNKIGYLKHKQAIRNTTLITGTVPDFTIARNWQVKRGNFFTRSDVDASRRVCVIGKSVDDDLFANVDAVGESLAVNGKKFKVIGIMESKGNLFDVDQDDQVFLPLSTAQRLFGVGESISMIFIQVPLAENIAPAMEESQRIIKKYLSEEDFNIKSQGETLSVFNEITSILTVMLGSIAAISLIVGGIGIMNIMIVSVTERTKEIGIRKAIGARDHDILLQFLAEAVVVSLLGGLIGIAISYGTSWILGIMYPTFKIAISSMAILTAILFSLGMGTFFGVYPAYKAAALDPIEALRYE